MKPLPSEVKAFVDAAHVCRIASSAPDGEPYVIPVCPVFDGETLYIDIGFEDRTAIALRTNPRLTVLIDEYDDDWTKLRKVVLRCNAAPVTGAEQDAAWARIREKYPQHSTVNWSPRHTLALTIYNWRQEGVVTPNTNT